MTGVQTCALPIYPGGFRTEEMFALAKELGYGHLFTVHPAKIRLSTPDTALPRHMILGNHDRSFEVATTFRALQGHAPIAGAIICEVKHPVIPRPGALVASRIPRITADLSKVENLDPSSIVMRVSGFGKVPATCHPETRQTAWKVTRRLRRPVCSVSLQWRLKDSAEYEAPMRWSFQIDRKAAYQPGSSTTSAARREP